MEHKDKFYKESDTKIWFLENVVDKVKQIIKPDHLNRILYIDKNTNKVYMEYNQKTGYLCIDEKIWSYFFHNYSINNTEIRELIKYLMLEYYNLEDIIPTSHLGPMTN